LGEKITTVHEPAAILAGPQVSPNPFFRRPGPTRSAPPPPSGILRHGRQNKQKPPPERGFIPPRSAAIACALGYFSRLAGLYHQKPLAAPRSPPPVGGQFSRFGIAARDSQRTRCAGGAGHARLPIDTMSRWPYYAHPSSP
jgi:hypothetical protein